MTEEEIEPTLKLDKQVTARLTEEERARFDVAAKSARLTPSQYARQLIMSVVDNSTPQYRLLVAEICATKALLAGVAVKLGVDKTDIEAYLKDIEVRKFAMADKRIGEVKCL